MSESMEEHQNLRHEDDKAAVHPQAGQMPRSRSLGMRLTSHIFFVFNALGYLVMGIAAALLTPWLREKFIEADIPVEFHRLTQVILTTPGYVYITVCTLIAILLTAKEFFIKNRVVTLAIEIIALIVSTVLIGLYAAGVILMLTALQQAVTM